MNRKEVQNIDSDSGYYGPLQICHSNAGYYIGRMFYDYQGYTEPGSRESDYFSSEEEAKKALKEGFEWRDVPENRMMYGELL